MGKLNNKQQRFSKCFTLLLVYAMAEGYNFVIEEVYRHPSATHGHKNSTHRQKLAGHILLFNDKGKFLTRTTSYLDLGEYWESLDVDARWGGRFNDGNHFSFEHNGVK